MTPAQADHLRHQILQRTLIRFQRLHNRPRILQFFLGQGPPAMWLAEYPAADPITFLCSGRIQNAWAITPDAIDPTHPGNIDPGEVTGRLWQRPLTGFALAPDATPPTLYLNELEGPQYGTLIAFDIKILPASNPDAPHLKVRQSILLMHGTLVG